MCQIILRTQGENPQKAPEIIYFYLMMNRLKHEFMKAAGSFTPIDVPQFDLLQAKTS